MLQRLSTKPPNAPWGVLPPDEQEPTPLSDASLSPPPPNRTLHDMRLSISDDSSEQAETKHPTAPPDSGHGGRKIRFLDGLRGLAALMVVTTHTRQTTVIVGAPAVDIFFVLSAFLLTMGFEKKTHTLLQQRASLRRWAWALLDYAQRRFLRVYPLFALVAIYLSFRSPADQKRLYEVRNQYDLWGVLTFQMERRYFVFWTLPLEIAYYFFIPVFVVAVVKLGKYWWVPLPPAAVFITYAGLTWYRWPFQTLGPHFPTFLTGSIAAVVYARVDAWIAERNFVFRWYHTLAMRTLQYGLLAIVVSIIFNGLVFHWIASNPVPPSPGFRFVHANVAIVLVCEMLRPGPLASVLEWSLLRNAGKISFSIYLWHGILGLAPWVWNQPSPYDRFFSIFGAVFVVGTISYHVVEAPCLRLASWLGQWIRKHEAEEVVRERLRLPTSTPLPETAAGATTDATEALPAKLIPTWKTKPCSVGQIYE